MFRTNRQLRDENAALRAQVAVQDKQLEALKSAIEGMDLRFKERTALISIVRDGRKIRFGFARYDDVHYIEVFGTWDDDVEQWRKDLLSKREK